MKNKIVNSLRLKQVQLLIREIWTNEGTLKHRVLTFQIKLLNNILEVLK